MRKPSCLEPGEVQENLRKKFQRWAQKEKRIQWLYSQQWRDSLWCHSSSPFSANESMIISSFAMELPSDLWQ